MSFLNINLEDVTEPKPVPHGNYALQITECQIVQTGEKAKNPGQEQFRVSIGIIGEDDAPNITHFVSLPAPEDDAKTAKFKALLLKRFLTTFNVKFDSRGIDTEQLAIDMTGAEANNVEVTLSEPDDNGNIYNRLKLPRLHD